MQQKIKDIINQSIQVKQSLATDEALVKRIEEVAFEIADTFQKGNKVLFCGNGGSAADAQHLAAEFTGRFYSDRRPLPAEALHVNTSFLTAVANDYNYDEVYQRAIKAHGKPGDVLCAFSTSGNSRNCVLAMQQAMLQQMKVIAFTGASGGQMKNHCHYLLNVASTDTPRIQETHILIGHIICQLVEEMLMERKFI
ncbi:MAG: D-sedoheptulose 7-phosphate isomerase [Chitinophagales bacterium]|nr:D-sedoheptulose 7-phosphate isomerase [Chitinophagales bacterium]MDW8273676.1 D-sedoheptulose 7-phosphate isomerase [Chitinophagales bacterium]